MPDACTPDDGLPGGSDWQQGIWLTARVELPLDVLAGLADDPDGDADGAGFGQEGPLDRQPPGATLAAFLPDSAVDLAGADLAGADAAAADGDACRADAGLPGAAGDGLVTGGAGAGLTGTVNLTLPLATLTGAADAPGELGGFGPLTGHTARGMAAAALSQPALRWCVTVTGPGGEAIGHGCAAHARPVPAGNRGTPGADGWTFTITVTALARGNCAHARQSAGYQPSPSLRHLIEIRSQRCSFPGCRRPAEKCDKDHTIPFDKGGRTCECNLAPLCRYHHRVKQSRGWQLRQPEPGTLIWVTPSGWKHIVTPDAHPI